MIPRNIIQKPPADRAMKSSPARHSVFKYLSTIFLFSIILGGPFSSFAVADTMQNAVSPPFLPGEKLTYRASWGAITAGELTMEVLPIEALQGTKAYHFAMTTQTKGFVDFVYKVRERQESYIDISLTHSLMYKKRAEGKHPRDVVVEFDWKQSKATRSNFGEKMSPVFIGPGTFDSLALFYVIRVRDLKPGRVLEIPISEGDNNILVKATIGKKEKIRIDDKEYDVVEVIPDMEGLESQQAVKKGDVPSLQIWFTDDERKLPVKIRSKVKIGYFVFELVSVGP